MAQFNIPGFQDRSQPLDVSPMSNALLELNRNAYRAEALRQQQEHLAMEQEKFGWTREEQAAQRAAAAELARDPSAFEAARRKASAGGSLPTTSSLYGMESTADALRNNQAFRAEVGGPTPGGRGSAVPPSAYAVPTSAREQATDPFAPGGQGRMLSQKTADFFKSQILDPSLDPKVAEQRYNQFRNHPDMAPHFEAGGYGKGDWRSEAQHVYDDAAARATGAAPPPRFAAAAPTVPPKSGADTPQNGTVGTQASPVYEPNPQKAATFPPDRWYITQERGPDGQLRPTAPRTNAPSAQRDAGLPGSAPQPSAPASANDPLTPAGAAPGAPPPIAPGQPAPLGQLPDLPTPPSAQTQISPAQQIASRLLDEDKRIANLALRYGQPNAKDLIARVQEMEKSGQYYVPGGYGVPAQMVQLPGVLEGKTAEKIATETATKDADMADRVYTGFHGQRGIAAAQKMNIGIVKTLLDDPNLAVGTAQGSQLWYQRAMSTLAEKFPSLGIDPTKAVSREVFNQTLTRILGDQFAGLKSTSGTAGEQASRIFAPMLGIEEKALPNEMDTIEGIKAKIGILDQVGDHMIEWGNLADAYKGKNGKLDPTFYTWINDRIAKARIAGYEGHDLRNLPISNPSAAVLDKDGRLQEVRPAGAGQQQQRAENGARLPVLTKEEFGALPDGPIDSGPFAGKIKQGMQLITPTGPPGSRTNPHPDSMLTNPKEGEYLYWKGRLSQRKGWSYVPADQQAAPAGAPQATNPAVGDMLNQRGSGVM